MTTLIERDGRAVWHPYTHIRFKDYLQVNRAEGSFIHTADGKKIFDGISSWWLVTHGHSFPPIVEALQKQAEQFSQVIFAGFTHEPAVELAELLLSLLPEHFSKVFLSDNGSTAVEVALKLALQYWHNIGEKRTVILAFSGGYHGDTFGAMSVSGKSVFSHPFEDFLFDVQYLDVPTEENIDQLLQEIAQLSSKHPIAALIAEPLVLGAGGMVFYPPHLLDRIVAEVKKSGAFFIADEVMTGFYRTGKCFATDYLINKPDLICLSKGITGGFLPLGATVISEQIAQGFAAQDKSKVFFHGHSFTGNALSCAAAVCNIKELLKAECLEKIQQLTDFQAEKVKGFEGLTGIGSVRAFGTIFAFDGKVNDTGYLSDLKERVYAYGVANEVLIRPLGNVVYVMPPFGSELQDLGLVYDVLKAGIKNNWEK